MFTAQSTLSGDIAVVATQVAANFRPKDIVDIFVVAFLIYALLILLRRTHSYFILAGMGVLMAINLVATVLDLYVTRLIFQVMLASWVVLVFIIFKRELRYFFEWVSSWKRIFRADTRLGVASRNALDEVVEAVTKLAAAHIGALIVFPGEQPLGRFATDGVVLNGKASLSLLLSLFDPSSPGHDGAVVIRRDMVEQFGAHLPLADKAAGPLMGTRHRAALGLAQETDALVIVVSEERGEVSVAHHGTIRTLKNVAALKDIAESFLRDLTPFTTADSRRAFLQRHWRERLIAVTTACVLWFVFAVQLGAGVVNRQFAVPIEFFGVPQGSLVEDVSPKAFLVTLAGRTQDFTLFDAESLRVSVDVAGQKPGAHKVRFSDEMLERPKGLSVVSVSHQVIQFSLQPVPPPAAPN